MLYSHVMPLLMGITSGVDTTATPNRPATVDSGCSIMTVTAEDNRPSRLLNDQAGQRGRRLPPAPVDRPTYNLPCGFVRHDKSYLRSRKKPDGLCQSERLAKSVADDPQDVSLFGRDAQSNESA